MHEYINNKKVLLLTTKNLDYIRNTQEITLLKENALSYHVIGSYSSSYFVRLLFVYFQLLTTRVSQYDTVMVGFAPQLIFPFWYWKIKRADIIIDFFISLYDTLCCDRKKIRPNGMLGKILHKLDAFTLRVAEAFICDTKAHGQFFCEEFQDNPNKMVTIFLEADASIYFPRQVKRPDYLENKYVVLYFGSVLPLQGIDVVLRAMELLKERKEFYFFFIGKLLAGFLMDPIIIGEVLSDKDSPEFYAHYKMMNTKTHKIYSNNFQLNVLDLNHAELATEEDRKHNIDHWAKLFKSTTWEEIKEMALQDEYFKEASNTLFELSADEIVRKRCRDREDYYADMRGAQNIIDEQASKIEQQKSPIANILSYWQ